jgi:predicted dehydrogenase
MTISSSYWVLASLGRTFEFVVLGIGIAGSGRRAAGTYAPAVSAAEDVRLAGVWGRDPTATKTLASAHDVPAFTDYDEFLEQCDAVAFAVPSPAQPDLAATAGRRGKAVLLERPIAGDLAGAEELAQAVERAGVSSQVALTWRYTSGVRQFLDVDAPGADPAGGRGRLVAPAPPATQWQAQRGLLRGGGVDMLDLLDAALGTIAAVRAHGYRLGWVGLFAEHQLGRVSEASLYTGGPDGSALGEVEVIGQAGSARVEISESDAAQAVGTMIGEFAEAVRHSVSPALDVRHGLHLQNALEEAESYLLLAD